MINWDVLKCIIYKMASSHAYEINHGRGDECHDKLFDIIVIHLFVL